MDFWMHFRSAVHTSAKEIVQQLSRSKIYQDYKRAFGEATGLPMALRAVEAWQLLCNNCHTGAFPKE